MERSEKNMELIFFAFKRTTKHNVGSRVIRSYAKNSKNNNVLLELQNEWMKHNLKDDEVNVGTMIKQKKWDENGRKILKHGKKCRNFCNYASNAMRTEVHVVYSLQKSLFSSIAKYVDNNYKLTIAKNEVGYYKY